MAQHPDGARVRHHVSGAEHTIVRRMPPNTALGREEEEEVEPVYELDDGSLAPHGVLDLVERGNEQDEHAEEG